jgi:hypothetical protein
VKKYAYIAAAGSVLLLLAGASWIAQTIRRPFARGAARRERIDRTLTHFQPAAEALRRRHSPAAEATRRQLTVWG